MPGLADLRLIDDLGPALDAEAMGARLHAHLRERDAAVLDCRVVRYRHRPGERGVVQYAVTVRTASGAVVDERVVGHWSAATPDALERTRKLARRAEPVLEAWTAAFPPVFHDATTGMVATTYPFDRRLPGLVEIAAGTSPLLLAPMRHHLGLADSAPLDVRVTPVRYREQLNAVVRYDVRRAGDGEAPAGRFYVKVYGDGGGARLRDVHQQLGCLTRDAATVSVSPAVTYDDTLGALVTAEATGTALDRTPLDRDRLEATLQTVAAGLAAFGRLTRGDDLPALAPAPQTGTERSVAALAAALPERAPMLRALAEATQAIGHGPTGAPALVHGDLKLEHVFVDGPRIRLIDLDSCHRGHAAWDLALLVERWWSARDAVAAERPLADWGAHVLAMSYFARVRPEGTTLPRLRCAASLDVAAGLVKRREPDWQARALRLVARAGQHLGTETA